MTKEEAIKSFEEDNHTMLENKTAYINELKARGMEFENRMVSYIDESVERNELAISALKDGWIPIEEREPEIEGEYWVTISKPYGTWVEKAWFHTDDKLFSKGSLFLYDVTAWREDIEPYKKGE